MYPALRMSGDLLRFAGKPMDPLGTHISHHRIYPWDLDMFLELNNGRTLTLYDIGRMTLAQRSGMWRLLRRNGWSMAVAGLSVRFRRRVHLFQRVEARARLVGWDARFFYIEQSMWRAGACTSHVLARMAVTDRDGIVIPDRLLAQLDRPLPSPVLPDWAQNWVEAEASRPWPPKP